MIKQARFGMYSTSIAAALLLQLMSCTSETISPAGTSSSSGGTGSSSGNPNVEPADITGCAPEIKLYENPADPSMDGAHPAGVKTIAVDGLTTEVWYPAPWGSAEGKEPETYDLRLWLPASEQAKIPDADNPWQVSKSYRDLPMDEAHGPYPVVIFLHGTAGFRTQSLGHIEHWASRGFVVLAADYPGLYLADALEFKFMSNVPADTQKIVDALKVFSGDLAFLKDRVDLSRLALVGHSAGGNGLQSFGDAARVLIPLAAAGADPGMTLESTLIMGGMIDNVVNYNNQLSGYDLTPPKKRLVGISKGAHLFPTELCWLVNSSGKNIVEVAKQYNVKNANLASGLFDCPNDQLGQAEAKALVNYSTSAVLEETLHCTQGDMFKDIKTKFPSVGEYKEQL